jgi:hypothetical protein
MIARLRYNRNYASRRPVISPTEDGLKLERYRLQGTDIVLETVWQFRWSEVQRIFAFKRDIHVVDLICIAFEFTDNTAVEIDEEMPGYSSVTATLPVHFPGLNAQWWDSVVFPAFATNWTAI